MAVAYLLGFIYLIYSRYLSDIIEDLIYLAEAKGGENMSQIVFCFLNSLCAVILCFITNFNGKKDLGISVVFGTDIFNIFLLYWFLLVRIIFKKRKKNTEERTFEAWLIFRDMIFYLLALGLVTAFLYLDNIHWGMALTVFLFSMLFFGVV